MNQALSQGPRIVHSSLGRLRLHLPDPDDQIAAALRRLPGVTYAEANQRTGNLLILFNPVQTNEQSLLASLQNPDSSGPSVAPPRPTPPIDLPGAVQTVVPSDRIVAVTEQDYDPLVDNPDLYVTGARRHLYRIFGWASVGMAVVGAILPGIPTAPFVILASYFFIRSSPKAHAWLLRSRWFGAILRDWEEQHGVRRSVKNTAVGLIAAGLVITWLVGLPVAVLAVILALEMIGLAIVLSLRVIEPAQA